MNVYSCWFGPERFKRMAHALRASLVYYNPAVHVLIEEIPAPPILDTYRSNTAKLAEWVRIVCASPDGTQLLLIDGDCLVIGDLSPAWAQSFEMALTRKPVVKRLPVNAGVVFLRVNKRVRLFMREWQAINDRMLRDTCFHKVYEAKYGGINQAALGYLREHDRLPHTIELPAEIYNACHEPLWLRALESNACVIHYKSSLRRALFQGPVPFKFRALVDLHRKWQANVDISRGLESNV